MITDSEKLSIIAHVVRGELGSASTEIMRIRQREECSGLSLPSSEEIALVRAGKKVAAIKAFRDRTGATLYGAKTMIDRL